MTAQTILVALLTSTAPALGLVAQLVEICRKEITERLETVGGAASGRWRQGRIGDGEKWEKVLEEVLVGTKVNSLPPPAMGQDPGG